MTWRRQAAGRAAAMTIGALAALAFVGASAACGSTEQPADGSKVGAVTPTVSPGTTAEVTFVELGSDSCVPCKAMRPIMDEIARKYRGSVAVVFYDVYEDSSRAQEFEIRVIPTQVFLDEGGKEFYRHEGFLTLLAVESLLAKRGIEPTVETQEPTRSAPAGLRPEQAWIAS